MIDKKHVLDLLGSVADPNTGQPISKSGKLESLDIQENHINVVLVMSGLTPDTKNQLNFACLNALYPHYPKAEVNIHFKTPEKSNPKNPLPHIKNIIAVASGKGGVGKSTISASLASGLVSRGLKVGLLDADLYGPSMPTMFGLQGQRPKMTKIHGQPKLVPIEKDGLHLISIGFIVEPEQAVILRGPRLGGIIKQFLLDCTWPELDYLIVDLPPGTGDIQLTLVQAVPVTASIIVTTPQEVAIADALKAANMFRMPNINIPILGVVENMSWFTPAELPDHKYYLFGQGGGSKLAGLIDSQVLGHIPLVQGVQQNADQGQISTAVSDKQVSEHLSAFIDKVIYQTEVRNKTHAASQIVEIKN